VAQTILGINSNLDTGGILDNLIQLQRSPIDIVESKRALEDAKLLSFQDLRDRLQTFKGVVNSLNTEARFPIIAPPIQTQSSVYPLTAKPHREPFP